MRYVKQKIGKVVVHTPATLPSDSYVDRGTEDILLELFKADDAEKRRREILINNPTWPLYYHLTRRRGNLLRWYEFAKGSSILEVGSGCGGITEELVRRDAQVTALELSPKRSAINAHRNKDAANLEIIIGNLQDFKPGKKFDYIVCVGVLEYAGTFIHTDAPYEYFLKKLSSLLTDKGVCLLAIENRFGLKYWAGAKEDHVHTFFEGHNGYPTPDKHIRTFGRKELSDLFLGAGFKRTGFYYPYPDYKNPAFVYSDAFYPGKGTDFPLGSLPTPTRDRPREHFFSEQAAMRHIEANDLFPDFSNSLLVEATK